MANKATEKPSSPELSVLGATADTLPGKADLHSRHTEQSSRVSVASKARSPIKTRQEPDVFVTGEYPTPIEKFE